MPNWLKGYNPSDLTSGPGVSGGQSSGGAVATTQAIAQKVKDALYGTASGAYRSATTTDTPYAQAVRDLFNYSDKNSAFNAEQAAIARDWSAKQNQLAMAHSASEAQKFQSSLPRGERLVIYWR